MTQTLLLVSTLRLRNFIAIRILFALALLVAIFTNSQYCQANYAQMLSGSFKITSEATENGKDNKPVVKRSQRLVTISARQPSSSELNLTVTEDSSQASPAIYSSSTTYSTSADRTSLNVHFDRKHIAEGLSFLKFLTWILKIAFEEVQAQGKKITKRVHIEDKIYTVTSAYKETSDSFSHTVYCLRFHRTMFEVFSVYIHLSSDQSQIISIQIHDNSANKVFIDVRHNYKTNDSRQA